MKRVVKWVACVVSGVLLLYAACGVGLNLFFRTVNYDYYRRAVQLPAEDASIQRLALGERGDWVGYIGNLEAGREKPLLLYFGGSGEIAYNAVARYKEQFADYAFACVDYPGSQESAGNMGLRTMQQAALALYDGATRLEGVDREQVALVSYSYGTGIAAYLAAQRECDSLVLIAPYGDNADLYQDMLPVFYSPLRLFITDNINTKAYAKSVREPTLLITSDGDTTLPSTIAYDLAARFAHAQVQCYEGLPHNGYWKEEAVVQAVRGFISGNKGGAAQG